MPDCDVLYHLGQRHTKVQKFRYDGEQVHNRLQCCANEGPYLWCQVGSLQREQVAQPQKKNCRGRDQFKIVPHAAGQPRNLTLSVHLHLEPRAQLL